MNYISVLVTFNRKELLIESIDSLLNQVVKPQKIILIDNASTDGTKDLLEETYGKTNDMIDYHLLPENIGGSGGFYEGMKKLKNYTYDWVSLSDDDAIYTTDFFEKINKAANKFPEIKCFSGTVRLEDGRVQTSHRRKVKNDIVLSQISSGENEYLGENIDIDIISFVGVVINREIIESIGLPDKDYFIWYDDIEYSFRIRKLTRIKNINSAQIIHKTKVASNDFGKKYLRDWKEYYGLRNRYLTVKKHSSNKILASIYNLYKYVGMNFNLIIKNKRFEGHRRYCFYLYKDAYLDYLKNRKGINVKYLPITKL